MLQVWTLLVPHCDRTQQYEDLSLEDYLLALQGQVCQAGLVQTLASLPALTAGKVCNTTSDSTLLCHDPIRTFTAEIRISQSFFAWDKYNFSSKLIFLLPYSVINVYSPPGSCDKEQCRLILIIILTKTCNVSYQKVVTQKAFICIKICHCRYLRLLIFINSQIFCFP